MLCAYADYPYTPHGWVVICDKCDQALEIPETNSQLDAHRKLKEQGWSISRSGYGRTWLHLCPDCKEPTK